MQYKYRLYCNTEDTWVETWSNGVPTECPNDSGHSIDSDNIVIVGMVRREDIRITIGGSGGSEYYYQCDTGEWELIRQFKFKGTNILGEVKSCSIIAEVVDSTAIAEFRLYDITNEQTVAVWDVTSPQTYSNNPENLPEEAAIFELHGKSASTEPNHIAKVSEVFIEFVT